VILLQPHNKGGIITGAIFNSQQWRQKYRQSELKCGKLSVNSTFSYFLNEGSLDL
jgi:hypothetical protein